MHCHQQQDLRRAALLGLLWSMAVLCLLSSVLWLCACVPQRAKEDQTPAGSSRLTKADAGALAAIYAAKHGGFWCNVAPTGSMAPVIDSRSVLLLEPYAGQPLNAGDIVCFDRGDNPNVCHRVVEVKDGAFYVSGDNNKWPDGWHKLAAIKYRVAGIIFTAR
jgi:hypothetical protein